MHATQPQTLIDRQARREKRLELRQPYTQTWREAKRPPQRWPLTQAGNLTLACAVPAALGWICLAFQIPALAIFWCLVALVGVAVISLLKWRASRRTGR